MAGFLINTRGTTVMVDPLLGGFDMPVMIEFPIATAELPKLDAVLVTHSNNGHYSVPTCRDLAGVTGEYHSTQYVASLMQQEGLPAIGHGTPERPRESIRRSRLSQRRGQPEARLSLKAGGTGLTLPAANHVGAP
jgi:hypothetical protein